ncbi:protein SOGA3a [Aulostomus maculatus]
MWGALMNGGGTAAGGGYVPSQGWEFVPCPRMERADRGRGKSRSPLRRISSPPTVFSHIDASPGGGGDGTPLELHKGQMWPGPEPQQQQQQAQHTRLKKKLEDLKKRHVHDKEAWMREKESLLREVADIQGGENRRILLDLKTVLEDVQVEVKKEEEKRSELQLQYTRDRCAWELERAEFKSRIAQLETREGAGLVSGGVQSVAGLGSAAARCSRELRTETSTLRLEREEQRRLLADTHSTTMDLRCRLDHSERGWVREKAELLERFDVERREWESQLKDMQRKIEELYCEVRAKREGSRQDSGRQEEDTSTRSVSTDSSMLSDNSRSELLSTSSQSEPSRHPPLPGFNFYNINSGAGSQFTENDQPELMGDLGSRGIWTNDTSELEAFFHKTPMCGMAQNHVTKGNEKNVHVGPQESSLLAELSYGSDKKKGTTALNAALKEIARVSEELCSYQDQIRNKSGDKGNPSASLCLSEEGDVPLDHSKAGQQLDEAPCDLSQIYDDLRALQRENWITLSPDNTWHINRQMGKSWSRTSTDRDCLQGTQTSTAALLDMDTPAPPVPLRTSSWNLSSSTHPDTELHIPESPTTIMRKCHSPCVLGDRKCSSPSIVRKFEAMLQENEGKVLVDGEVASCSVPSNSNCNMGCCHNRWSCDASKFSSSKLSTYGTVQKSFSEVNIVSAGRSHSNYSPGIGNLQSLELQMPQIIKELPVDLLLSSLEKSPASSNLQGSRRNIMLEQKTAEFNRTLFQAEMGRGVEEEGNSLVTDGCSVGCQPVLSATCRSDELLFPRKGTFQPHCSDATTSVSDVKPEITLSLSISGSPVQNPDVRSRQSRCNPDVQEVRMKQEIPSDLQPEKSQFGLRDSPVPHHNFEVKHKVQTTNSPSKKSQHRLASEGPSSEPVLSVNTQPSQNVEESTSKKDNALGAKPQPTREDAPLQLPSAENKQAKLVSAPPLQSDSSRPGPRMMTDHPWKPLTLAAYPRPEGSRSNYGAVERILKHYESAARAHQNQSKPDEMASSLNSMQEQNVTDLNMQNTHPLAFPPSLRHTQTNLSATGMKETQLTVQEFSSCIQKNFSRPACPANRRLPSRWANRSPTSSSSTSSSPSTTPIIPPAFPLRKHSSSFTYSNAFHIETVII